jgi:hypothetical protein
MRSLPSILVLGSSLISGLALGSCAADSSTDGSTDTGTAGTADTAEAAIDSADAASAEGNMMMAAADGSNASASELSAEAVIGNISANIGARFQPPSCATVTQTAQSLTAVFNDCAGIHGLVHVTGELDLAISVLPQQGTVTVHAISSGLKVNGATLTIDATAAYSSQGSSHQLTVITAGSGTGQRGNTVDHDGSYTLTWDPDTQCHSLVGSWSAELGARTRSNEVDMARCGTGCPTGSVIHKFLGGKSIEIELNGTATASWAGSAGGSGTVQLSCP